MGYKDITVTVSEDSFKRLEALLGAMNNTFADSTRWDLETVAMITLFRGLDVMEDVYADNLSL